MSLFYGQVQSLFTENKNFITDIRTDCFILNIRLIRCINWSKFIRKLIDKMFFQFNDRLLFLRTIKQCSADMRVRSLSVFESDSDHPRFPKIVLECAKFIVEAWKSKFKTFTCSLTARNSSSVSGDQKNEINHNN